LPTRFSRRDTSVTGAGRGARLSSEAAIAEESELTMQSGGSVDENRAIRCEA
jgi:hypothetical protein